MAKLSIALSLLLCLGGCSTLKQHPVLTAVGAAILAGSIVAIAQHHGDHHHQPMYSCDPQAGIIGTCTER